MALKVGSTLLVSYHCQRLFGTKNVLYFGTQVSAQVIICDIDGFTRLSSDCY